VRSQQWSEPGSVLIRLVGRLFALAFCLFRNREQVLVWRWSIIRRQSSGYRQTTSEHSQELGCALQLRASNLQMCWTEKDGLLPAQLRVSSYFDALLREPRSQSAPDFASAR